MWVVDFARRIMESPSTLIGNLGPSPVGARLGPGLGAYPPAATLLHPKPPLPALSGPHMGGVGSPQRRRPPPLLPHAKAGGAGASAPAATERREDHQQQQEQQQAQAAGTFQGGWDADASPKQDASSAALCEELQRSKADVRKLQARAQRAARRVLLELIFLCASAWPVSAVGCDTADL